MIVIPEGASDTGEVTRIIMEATDLDPRVTVLGHIQRGGSPNARDKVSATKMGYIAVERLAEGKTKRMVCTHDGGFTDVDMGGLATKKTFQSIEADGLEVMTGI